MTNLKTIKFKFKVETNYPIAYESHDHIDPKGTKADNTHHPRFVEASEKIFHLLNHLDLGCSGGGLVKDFLDRGHLSIGIEGSDYSLKHKRAEWATIPDNLFTADITKPFKVLATREERPDLNLKFNIVTAWEVLEHIHEKDLPQLIDNIRFHLIDEGLFVCSVATFPDGKWHVTLKPKEWWVELFGRYGFKEAEHLYEKGDFVRKGSFNIVFRKSQK